MQPLLKLALSALVILTPFIANAQDTVTSSCAVFANLSQQHIIELIGENAPAADGGLERRLAWSPDGTQIAVGVVIDAGPHIQIWDAAQETLVATLEVDERFYSLFDLEWSPDGSRVAAAYYDAVPQIWDAEHGWERLTLEIKEPLIGAVFWSPDSTQLAVLAENVTIWNAENGHLLQTVDGASYGVDVVRFDEEWYLAAQFDRAARVINIGTGEVLFELDDVIITDYDWTADHRLLALLSAARNIHAIGAISIWDIDQNEKVFDLQSGYITARLLPNTDILMAITIDGEIEYWNMNSRTKVSEYDVDISNLFWPPNGTCQAIVTFGEPPISFNISIYDVATGEEAAVLSGHIGHVIGVEWSPDGTQLASISYDGTLRIWGSPSSES